MTPVLYNMFYMRRIRFINVYILLVHTFVTYLLHVVYTIYMVVDIAV